MSVHYDGSRRRFVVRWREDGRNRTRRFATEAEALAFDETLTRRPAGRPSAPTPSQSADSVDRSHRRGDGIYAYRTSNGLRWRFVFRQSDGTLSSRRGFGNRSQAVAARRRLLEEIRRGEVRVSRESFETFWHRVLRDKKPFMTAGSHQDFATHGRKRLLPFFGRDRLSSIDEDRVRDWLETMVDLVDAGDLAPKTVNNARTYLTTRQCGRQPGKPLIRGAESMGVRMNARKTKRYGAKRFQLTAELAVLLWMRARSLRGANGAPSWRRHLLASARRWARATAR